MNKFDYATIDTGCNAWTNGGKLRSAQAEFTNRVQGKPVSDKGIEKALIGLKVWGEGWGFGSRTVTKVVWDGFFQAKGLAKVKLYNDGNMFTSAYIRWDPKTDVIEDKPKSKKDLEKRVSDLEAQVAMLVKALAAK